MQKREFIDKVFKKSKDKGFKACEIYESESESFRVNIFENKIDTYSVNSTSGVGFRGVLDRCFGYAYSEKTDDESADLIVEKAVENALISEPKDIEPDSLIYEGDLHYPEFNNYSSELALVSDEEKIDMAFTLEREIYKKSSKIKSIQYCSIGYFSGSVGIINTKGLNLTHRSNGMYLMAVPVADDDGRNNSTHSYKVSLNLKELDPYVVAEEAVEKVLAYEGAQPCPTGKYRVLIKNEAMFDLLETFSSIFSAKKAQEGMSLLKGRTGQIIGSDSLTIIDDPLNPELLGSSPFDSEGVSGRKKDIVRSGELKTLLYNMETAAKEGKKSTGNANRSSYASAIDIACSNFYIDKGRNSFDDLLANDSDTIIITEFQGLHSGANPISGDFSLAAKGFNITAGKQGTPIKQITAAGNFFKLLMDIEQIGDDLIFGLPSSRGCFGSPSVIVRELSIAGK